MKRNQGKKGKKEGKELNLLLPSKNAHQMFEEKDFWNVHDDLIASSLINSDESGGIPVKLRQFLNANVISKSEDPLKVWQKLKDIYPKVYEVAMKYFVVAGMSVPSERLFSAAGDIISAKRKIMGKRASQIVFLGSLPERYWN